MMRRFNTETRRVERVGGLGSWEQVKGGLEPRKSQRRRKIHKEGVENELLTRRHRDAEKEVYWKNEFSPFSAGRKAGVKGLWVVGGRGHLPSH